MSCTLLLLACALAPQGGEEAPAPTPPPSAAAPAPARSWWQPGGWLDLSYVGRWTGGAHDNDLEGYGLLTFGDEDHDTVTAEVSGRGVWDLDRNHDPGFVFHSIEDSYDADVAGYLYTGYVDLHGAEDGVLPKQIRRIRIGRQVMYDTPVALFLDGASVTTAPMASDLDLVLQAYAGVPSNIFEESPDGDVMGGAAVSLAPWTNGTLRADYVHITDRYLGTTNRDDLFGLRWQQRVGSSWNLDAHANLIEQDWRDAAFGITYQDDGNDLRLVARYTALWEQQSFRAIQLDQFVPLLGTYFAYHEFELSGYKGFGDHLYLEAGAQARELADNSNEGVFNHAFQRYWATPGVVDWPWSGLDLSVTGEFWHSQGDEFSTFGADATQKIDDRWRLSVGTYFELFRYDALTLLENENVQVTYAKVRYQLADGWQLRTTLEFEDGEEHDFIELHSGLRIDF